MFLTRREIPRGSAARVSRADGGIEFEGNNGYFGESTVLLICQKCRTRVRVDLMRVLNIPDSVRDEVLKIHETQYK